LGGESLEGGFARATLKIEDDAFLVAINPKERSGLPFDKRRTDTPRVVTVGLFNLNYFGSHVGEEESTEGACHNLGGVKNGHAF